MADSTVVMLKKPMQPAEFGTALRHTLCPECQRFMKFKASTDALGIAEDGVMEANCCGRTYHMYMETVTIERVKGRPTPTVNPLVRHHSHRTDTRVV
jgi:hypothetical protein